VVRVGELRVSPLSPASGCSARRRLPSRGSLGPHFPTFLGTMRRYDCRLPVSGGFACRSPPRYLACFRRSWSPKRARDQVEALGRARAFGHPVPLSGHVIKETGGSPKFPSYPYGCMPRSQTPVVSSTLAIPRPGLLPSGACKPSAFPSIPLEGYPLCPRLYTFRGSITRPASSLHPASYGPLRGGTRVRY
jgi:hypothetical protein